MGCNCRPLVERIEVREPCSADWDSMPGDTTRFCASCDKNVHDLSELSVSEAEALLGRHRGQELCVRTPARPKRRLSVLAALLVLACGNAEKPAPKPAPPPKGKTLGCICVPGDPLCSCL